jgi:hypothetical protein
MATSDPSFSSGGTQQQSTSGSSSGPPLVRPSVSPAERCHADALASVFAFVPLDELPAVMQTCRSWNSAEGQEIPRGLTLQLRRPSRLKCLQRGRSASRSPLLRHISAVKVDPCAHVGIQHMRAMQSLQLLIALDVAPEAAEIATATGQRDLRAALPPRLQSFTLLAPLIKDTASQQTVIAAMPALHSLQTLTLHSRQHSVNEFLSVEPLLHLPRLTELCLDVELSPAQLDVIKRMGSLRKLNINQGRWLVKGLRALCTPPHRLQQLQELDLSDTEVGVGHMTELIQLPGLTMLKPTLLAPSAIPLLPRLERLHTIRLDPALLRDAVHLPQLCYALRQCTSLTTVVVELYAAQDAHRLPELLAAVAGLRVLQIEQSALPSLHFLRHAPQLEELHLLKCKEVRPVHLLGAAALLPQLRVLRVHDCSGVRLDEWELELLQTPGSALLPQLRQFDYSTGEEISRAVYLGWSDYDFDDPYSTYDEDWSD